MNVRVYSTSLATETDCDVYKVCTPICPFEGLTDAYNLSKLIDGNKLVEPVQYVSKFVWVKLP